MYLLNFLYLLSNCFDMEDFQITLAERSNVIHVIKINSFKDMSNTGYEWFNQGFLLEVKKKKKWQ